MMRLLMIQRLEILWIKQKLDRKLESFSMGFEALNFCRSVQGRMEPRMVMG